MPTYEYICTSCNNAWEEVQKISEPALEACPACHKPTAKRQISAGNFILKGGGWYADLYSSSKPGAKKEEGGGGNSTSSSTETKGETKAAPAKEASTPPAAAAPAASSGGGSSSAGSKD